MLSHEQNIDTKPCIALLPTGKSLHRLRFLFFSWEISVCTQFPVFLCFFSGVLLLHITKDLYQELGLVGQVSKFHSKTQMKYVVRVDLTAPHFQQGKKNFERVKWCLSERLNLSFNFLITWIPNGATSLHIICLILNLVFEN